MMVITVLVYTCKAISDNARCILRVLNNHVGTQQVIDNKGHVSSTTTQLIDEDSNVFSTNRFYVPPGLFGGMDESKYMYINDKVVEQVRV